MKQLDFWPELLEEAKDQELKKIADLRLKAMIYVLEKAIEELNEGRGK